MSSGVSFSSALTPLRHCLFVQSRTRYQMFTPSSKRFSSLSQKTKNLSLMMVTNRQNLSTDQILAKTAIAIDNQVEYIQLRDQPFDQKETYKTASLIVSMLEGTNTTLVINDDAGMVKMLRNGTGRKVALHLGQTDAPYEDARELLGNDTIIGLTVNSTDDIYRVNKLKGIKKPNYLGVQVFTSGRTKTDTKQPWGEDKLRLARRCTDLPIIAIGGITQLNIKSICQILKNGDGVAMAGRLWDFPEKEIQAIFELMRNADQGKIAINA